MRVMFKIYLDAFMQVVIFCSNMNLQKEREKRFGIVIILYILEIKKYLK